MALKKLLESSSRAASSVARAAHLTLSSDVISHVPACAQDCFQSFVDVNFDVSVCGSSPDLRCLCQYTGGLGYTLGEGAYECIAGEASRGSCDGDDVKTPTNAAANNMCSGIAFAATGTHSTLVATMSTPSGTGAITWEGPKSTSTAAVVSTATETSTAPSVTIAPSSTATPVPPTPAPWSSSTPSSLSTAQVLGICSGAFVAVALIVLALVLLSRCYQRRRLDGQEEEGFARMRTPSTLGAGTLIGNYLVSPAMRQKSAPIRKTPVELDFKRPGDVPFGTPSPPSGLAITSSARHPAQKAVVMPSLALSSTARNQNNTGTPPSLPPAPTLRVVNATPPRPRLTLTIHPEQLKLPKTVSYMRDSVVTEFAEDGEDLEAVAHIWRPAPKDSQPAITFFVNDGWGGRNSGNAATQSPAANETRLPPTDHSGAKLEAPGTISTRRAGGADSRQTGLSTSGEASAVPRTVPLLPPLAELDSPIGFPDKGSAQAQGRFSAVSTEFSPSTQTIAAQTKPPLVQHATDRYIGLLRKHSSRTNGAKRQSARKSGRRRSVDSATTIDSNNETELSESEGVAWEKPHSTLGDTLGDLSPVMESPRTPISPGKSPVSYPRIPTSAASPLQQTPQGYKRLSLLPQPLRSEKPLLQMLQPKSTGQLRLTLGTTTSAIAVPLDSRPVKPVPPLKIPPRAKQPPPAKGPALNPFPNLNPGQIRTGSPDTRLGAVPSSEQVRRQRMQARSQFSHAIPPRDGLRRRSDSARLPVLDVRQQQQQQQGPWQPSPPSAAGSSTQESQRELAPVSALSSQSYRRVSSTVPSLQARAPEVRPRGGQAEGPCHHHHHHQHQQHRKPSMTGQSIQQQQLLQAQQYRQKPVQHNASQSSLMAKRLGPDQAAGLALHNASTSTGQAHRWRRQSGRPSRDQSDPGYPGPASVSLTAAPHPPPMARMTPSVIIVTSPTTATAKDSMEPVKLPSTPGWLPHITPTNRGNDLFLNVR